MRAPAWSIVLLLVLVLLDAGCLGPSAPPGASLPQQPPALVLEPPVRVEGRLTSEPAIAQTPEGTLFVAGYAYGDAPIPGAPRVLRPDLASPPVLWSSADAGRTWNPVDVGTPADGALGNSDVDLAVGPEGNLYFISMTFSHIGHIIALGASRDQGVSWRWSLLSAQPLVDRPWVEAAPDGTVHAVWNDGYAVHHARSRDAGQTWSEGAHVHEPGGDGGLAVGPQGQVAVRIIPNSGSGYTSWPGEDGVAVSTDAGDSWTFQAVPGTRDYANNTPVRWADPVAFDAAANLYTAWGDQTRLLLASSPDLGQHWNVGALADGNATVWFPFLRGGAKTGELAATWFTIGEGDAVGHVGHAVGADAAAPSFREAAFATDTPGGTGGEYFQVAFLRDGSLGFATTMHPAGSGPSGFVYHVARGLT